MLAPRGPPAARGPAAPPRRRAAAAGPRWRRSGPGLTAPAPAAALAAAAAAASSRGRRRRAAAAAAAAGAGDDAVAEGFLSWAAAEGLEVNSKLGFAPDPATGRRVVCRSSVAEGEVLVRLPSAAAATVDLAPGAPPPPELSPLAGWWTKHSRASLRLAAKLAFERERLEPYLAMLPELEDIQAPWRWRDEELRFVSGEVAELARARREALEAASADLEALDCWSSSPRELFLRANHAVTSRAFSGRDQAFAAGPGSDVVSLGAAAGALLVAAGGVSQGLISLEAGALGAVVVAGASAAATATVGSREVLSALPMVDQVNHASGPLPDLALGSLDGCWELKAHRAFGTGEEVVFSYGAKDNDALLLQHGFVEEDNPADAVALPVGEDLELSEQTRTSLEDLSVQRLRFERNGAASALAPEGDSFVRVDLSEAALAEAAAEVLRPAVQSAEAGELSEAKDAEVPGAVASARRAELVLLWRRERRRLLAEAAGRWL